MEIFVLGALIGLIPAAIASSKGYSFVLWWFFGAMLFIVALPVALLIGPNRAAMEQSKLREGMKKCPFCAELIRLEAIVCKHCGRDLMPSETVSRPGLCRTVDNGGNPTAGVATLGDVSDTPETSDKTGLDQDKFARLLSGERLPPRFDEQGRPLEQVKEEQGSLAGFFWSE